MTMGTLQGFGFTRTRITGVLFFCALIFSSTPTYAAFTNSTWQNYYNSTLGGPSPATTTPKTTTPTPPTTDTSRGVSNNPSQYECNLSGSNSNTSGGLPGCVSGGTGGGTRTAAAAVTSNSDDSTCNTTHGCGARADAPLAVAPINAHGACYWVDNSSSNAIFVPFRSTAEWQNFGSNYPRSYITLTACSLPYSQSPGFVTISPPYPSSTSAKVDVPSVFGRADGTGTSLWPSSPQLLSSGVFRDNGQAITSSDLTSYSGDTTVQALLQWKAGSPSNTSWTLSAIYSPNLRLTATDITTNVGPATTLTIASGDQVRLNYTVSSPYGSIISNTPSRWNGINGAIVAPTTTTTYAMTSMDNYGLSSRATVTVKVTAAAGGVCGADGGQILSGKPSNLCASGDNASPVTASTSGWSWSCTPISGGTSKSCSATLQAATCGSVSADASGNILSGTACTAGVASAISGGAYTCTTGNQLPAMDTDNCTVTTSLTCGGTITCAPTIDVSVKYLGIGGSAIVLPSGAVATYVPSP